MSATSNAKVTSIKLEEQLRLRIHALAEAKDRSAHWLMNSAIAEYVEREEKHENFRNEALEVFERFSLTGEHLTGEEVDIWLERLENGEVAEPPKCHV